MPTATQTNTTPTRRSALSFSAAAIVAGLTAPVLAKGPRVVRAPDPNAALISLCDQMVATETERYLLLDHDDYAPDFGPNNARYEWLGDEVDRLADLIEDCAPATGPAGHAAVARAALIWVELNLDGGIKCDDRGEDMMVLLAQGLAPDFVWPPRAGSCSTAHWAPPMSAADVDAHLAASKARWAPIEAKIAAEKAAEQAERDRLDTPHLLTDDELRRRVQSTRKFKAVSDQMHAELAGEMARRGLV